jgi:hypothetical protein
MSNDEENPSSGAPHTNALAKPNKWEIASTNRKIIRVKDGHYRSAVISGVFVVAESPEAYGRNKDGQLTIEVECYWYEWKPKTRWMRLTLTTAEEELSNYTDEVVRNIGD